MPLGLCWGLCSSEDPSLLAKIATARVASDGTYLLQARITTKGSYSLKVLGGAAGGNVSGTSAATTVSVS